MAGPVAPPSSATAGIPSTTGSPGASWHKKQPYIVQALTLSHACCFDQRSGVFCSSESDSSTRQLVDRRVGVVNCTCH